MSVGVPTDAVRTVGRLTARSAPRVGWRTHEIAAKPPNLAIGKIRIPRRYAPTLEAMGRGKRKSPGRSSDWQLECSERLRRSENWVVTGDSAHLRTTPAGVVKFGTVAGVPVETLRRVPLFEELDERELQSIADSMNEATVPAGAIVTAEGGPGDGFFVIASGGAEVTIEGSQRAAMTAGDYFGEIALLLGSSRTATVTASTDLRCYALTPWDFRTLVEGSPSIAWKVMQSMAARLS